MKLKYNFLAFLVICTLLFTTLSLTGCDFLNSTPTSIDFTVQ
jgi:hypothetical protein